MTDNDNVNPEQTPPVPSGRNNNAWLVRLVVETSFNSYLPASPPAIWEELSIPVLEKYADQ